MNAEGIYQLVRAAKFMAGEQEKQEKEMEEKKRLTLAAIKDGETIEFNRMSDDKNFRTKGTKNKKPEEDDPNPPRAKSRGPTTPSLPASSSGLGRGPAVVVQAKTKTRSRSRRGSNGE